VHNLGTGALQNCIQNYFPHLWDDPVKAKAVMVRLLAKHPLEGPKGFLKQRTYDLFREGLAAGLKPVHDNPVDMWLLKKREVERYILAHSFVNEMKARGLLKFSYVFSKPPEGWSTVDDRAFTVYGPPTVTIKEAFDAGMREKTLEVLDHLTWACRTIGSRSCGAGSGAGNGRSPGLRGRRRLTRGLAGRTS
jgi:hypothetical protein